MSGSSIVVPDPQLMGDYATAIGQKLYEVALAAKTDLDTFVGGAPSTNIPQPLGTASAGVGTAASAYDHVHALPASTLGVHFARGVVTANVASLSAFTVASRDGLTLVQNDRVLLVGQTTKTQNGIYVVGLVTTGTAPLTRPIDWTAANPLPPGAVVEVNAGTLFANTTWKVTTAGAVTVDTSSIDLYPRFVAQAATLVLGTVNLGNVPILSATKTTYSINRITPNTSTLTVGGYHPAAAATPGVVGTASVDIQAEVAAGSVNASDISSLLVGIHNW